MSEKKGFRIAIDYDLVKITQPERAQAKSYECLDYVKDHVIDERLTDYIFDWSTKVVHDNFQNPEGIVGRNFYAAIFQDESGNEFIKHIKKVGCHAGAENVLHFIISKHPFPFTEHTDDETDVYHLALIITADGRIMGVSKQSDDQSLETDTTQVKGNSTLH